MLLRRHGLLKFQWHAWENSLQVNGQGTQDTQTTQSTAIVLGKNLLLNTQNMFAEQRAIKLKVFSLVFRVLDGATRGEKVISGITQQSMQNATIPI